MHFNWRRIRRLRRFIWYDIEYNIVMRYALLHCFKLVHLGAVARSSTVPKGLHATNSTHLPSRERQRLCHLPWTQMAVGQSVRGGISTKVILRWAMRKVVAAVAGKTYWWCRFSISLWRMVGSSIQKRMHLILDITLNYSPETYRKSTIIKSPEAWGIQEYPRLQEFWSLGQST